MKRGKKLIAAAAALGLIVGFYFLVTALTSAENGNNPGETTAPGYLFDFGDAQIEEIDFEYGEESSGLVYKEGTWFSKSDKNMPIDQTKAKKLSELFKTAQILRTLDGDTGEFGLDKPLQKITVKTGNIKTEIIIGKENAAVGGYYAKTGSKVCLIDPSLPEGFMIKLYSLVAADNYPSLNTTNVRGLSLSGKNGKLELFYSQEGSPKVYTPRFKWFSDSAMTKPVRSEAATVIAGLISELTYTECVDYLATTKELKEKYGLADPDALLIEYHYQDNTDDDNPKISTHRVRVGATAEQGYLYFTWDGTEMVYTVEKEKIDEIFSYNEGLEPSEVCLVEPDDILKMTVTYKGKSATVTRSIRESTDSEGKKTTVAVYESGGKIIQNELAEGIITAFTGLTSDKITESKGGEEFLRIDLVTSRKGFETLSIVAYTHDSNFYRVYFDGSGQSKLVSLRTIQALGEAIEKIAK